MAEDHPDVGSLPTGGAHRRPARRRVAGRGFVDRVTILPRNVAPRFSVVVSRTADLEGAGDTMARGADSVASVTGSHIRLIWAGQRQIPGILPGIEMAFEGMLSIVDGVPTIYNPRYEIIGRSEETT